MLLLLLSRFSHVRLCVTQRRQPTRLLHPWESPGKNTGVGRHFLLQCMNKSLKALLKGTMISIMVPGLVSANLVNQKLRNCRLTIAVNTLSGESEAVRHTQRAEGLLFLHGLESNLESSLQTPQGPTPSAAPGTGPLWRERSTVTRGLRCSFPTCPCLTQRHSPLGAESTKRRVHSGFIFEQMRVSTPASLFKPEEDGENPDAGKARRQEEKGVTEDEMAGWHHQLDGHEFE